MKALALAAAFALTAHGFAQDLAGDLALHKLLIDGEDWQPVAEGLGFADGPCADNAGNFYFSDIKAPAIFKIAPDGTRTKIADEPASGLKLGPTGWLYACQRAKKRLVAIDLARRGAVEKIAVDVQPNNLVVTAGGHLYFTEMGTNTVRFVDVSRGWGWPLPVKTVDTGIAAPLGIALSPDEGTLAVSEHEGEFVWTFRVNADGSLDAKTPYMTMRRPIDPAGEFKFNEPPPLKKAANGDGMTTDSVGRWYVTSALGVQVFDPTGRLCGVLPKPQPDKPLTSCAIVRDQLYVTNGDKIFRRRVQAEGAAR